MIANHWRATNRITKENCHKNKVHVHDNAIRSNAILPSKFHKLKIIENINK